MRKATMIIALLLLFAAYTNAQTMAPDGSPAYCRSIQGYCGSNYADIANSLARKGWKFYYTSNTRDAKTYIWYYGGSSKPDRYAPMGVRVRARFWVSFTYTDNSTCNSIDYNSKRGDYKFDCN